MAPLPFSMALRIDDPACVARLAQLEGQAWGNVQRVNSVSPYCVEIYRKAWADYQDLLASDAGIEWRDFVSAEVRGDGAIYGNGGYHRYVVTEDGNVVLLSWSARPESIAKASALGIDVK